MMTVIGYEHVRDEIDFTPAKLTKIDICHEVRNCPECTKESNEANIVKADVPEPLMPKSFATEFLIAWVMYQKYAHAIPLYRQERDWRQYGPHTSRTTLANRIINCAPYFWPLYEYFH